MMMRTFIAIVLSLVSYGSFAQSENQDRYVFKIKAKDKYERSAIADLGLAIDRVGSDYVMSSGTLEQKNALSAKGLLLDEFSLLESAKTFPREDSEFHDYDEMLVAINELANRAPDIVHKEEIGQSLEGRRIYNLRITTESAPGSEKPAIVFMAGHHSREHVSVELALFLAKNLVDLYLKGDHRVVGLISNREIHIIPLVNPDGAEYDIRDNRYHMWRKNKHVNKDRTFGVDLNRNYGYKWGTGGSSTNPSSDVYMGETPFSEPETQVIKQFVEAHKNITILATFHTFSELILYPWGHTYNSIANDRDFRVHKTMAETMAKWNGYTPQQSSDLYIASGDTTDWSYGEHGIISFTFELDPASFTDGGFYPGQGRLPEVYRKNWEPCLYLIGYSDNPYRVLEPGFAQYGLNSPIW